MFLKGTAFGKALGIYGLEELIQLFILINVLG